MRLMHLQNLDLNLIYPLYALLEECHVTRAAKRSFLSQSAMSRALERLRDMFGNPLRVRNGRGYERSAGANGSCESWSRSFPVLRVWYEEKNSFQLKARP
jgi:Bacterial regulatory helix-turn-helix protein, lysR family